MKLHYIFIFLSLGIFLFSCSDEFLETSPTVDVSKKQLSEVPSANEGILSGIYTHLFDWSGGNHDNRGHHALILASDLMSGDIVQSKHHWFGFDYNMANRNENYRRPRRMWQFYYRIIGPSNDILLSIPSTATEAKSKQIRGQALFLRAFAYYYLINFFQHTYKGHENDLGVPVYTEPTSEGKSRGTVKEVYDQMVVDLLEAESLLDGYSRKDITFVDKSVVQGLLARVYLTMENYSEAAKYAALAKAEYTLFDSVTYATPGTFSSINSSEWMWGADINSETTSIYASFLSHMDNNIGGYAGGLFAPKLVNDSLWYKIPNTDVRKYTIAKDTNVVAVQTNIELPPYAILKFYSPANFTGDLSYMRVSEMYFIEAEAKARSGDVAGAQQVLFDIMQTRDRFYVKSDKQGEDLLEEIFFNKRVEHLGEGLTFFDIKRLKKGINRVGNHRTKLQVPPEDKRFIYRIPNKELEANTNITIADQND